MWQWKVVPLHLTATYLSLQTSWNAYASRAKANARSMKNEKKIAALHYILSSVDGVARGFHPVHSTKCNKDIKYSYEAKRLH